jgi:hypothetical protein
VYGGSVLEPQTRKDNRTCNVHSYDKIIAFISNTVSDVTNLIMITNGKTYFTSDLNDVAEVPIIIERNRWHGKKLPVMTNQN